MPRRFFRKFAFKRHAFTGQPFIAPFRHLMHDHQLWGIRRKSVLPAVAIGVFVAFLPIPGHMLVAALASIVIRANIPVAALATFVSNPVTLGPIYYFCYRVGAKLLGIVPRPFNIELSLKWMTDTLVSIWQPMILGCVLVGTVTAMTSYVFLDVIWRSSIADYKLRKRNRH